MAVSAKPGCFNAAYFGNDGLQANRTLTALSVPRGLVYNPGSPSRGLLSGNMLRTSEIYPPKVHRVHFSSRCVYSFTACSTASECELPFSDSFALLFKINYFSVLVSVPLEDELEATFPSSSSSSLLIFKVANQSPDSAQLGHHLPKGCHSQL